MGGACDFVIVGDFWKWWEIEKGRRRPSLSSSSVRHLPTWWLIWDYALGLYGASLNPRARYDKLEVITRQTGCVQSSCTQTDFLHGTVMGGGEKLQHSPWSHDRNVVISPEKRYRMSLSRLNSGEETTSILASYSIRRNSKTPGMCPRPRNVHRVKHNLWRLPELRHHASPSPYQNPSSSSISS